MVGIEEEEWKNGWFDGGNSSFVNKMKGEEREKSKK